MILFKTFKKFWKFEKAKEIIVAIIYELAML